VREIDRACASSRAYIRQSRYVGSTGYIAVASVSSGSLLCAILTAPLESYPEYNLPDKGTCSEDSETGSDAPYQPAQDTHDWRSAQALSRITFPSNDYGWLSLSCPTKGGKDRMTSRIMGISHPTGQLCMILLIGTQNRTIASFFTATRTVSPMATAKITYHSVRRDGGKSGRDWMTYTS
jgi:hypothetical protein